MSSRRKNVLMLIVWLVGFGSLLVYLYVNFTLAYLVITMLVIFTMVKPPPDFEQQWGLWLGIVIPIFGTIGYAIATG